MRSEADRLGVRGERYQVVEGKTPEISVVDARRLLQSVSTAHVVGLRDRAILASFGVLNDTTESS